MEHPPSTTDIVAKSERPFLTPPTIALIVANLIPLFGVVFGDWNLRMILLIYWAESAIIGFYHILRMIRFYGGPGAAISVFFVIHYGIFMLVHCGFILVLTSGSLFGRFDETDHDLEILDSLLAVGKTWPMIVSLLALFLSHGVSFVRYAVLSRPADLPESPAKFMAVPYVRIVLMHLTLLFGAIPVLVLGSPIFLLVILIVGKIVVDLWSHRREHRTDVGLKSPGPGRR